MSSDSKTTKGAALTGVIAALAASSCCIPPVVAMIAGIGGASSSLSWMEPFRPYLIGLAVVAIGYAWYSYLKPKRADDCGCDIEKPKFYQTKGYLIGITLFAAVAIAFPYYSGIFYPDNKKEIIIIDQSNIQKYNISIEGMTCSSCENHVVHAVNELSGIVDVRASYDNANAIVEFDQSKTSIDEIEKAVNSTGYKAVNANPIN